MNDRKKEGALCLASGMEPPEVLIRPCVSGSALKVRDGFVFLTMKSGGFRTRNQ
jgi:hypothetical protein